jgi:hypothetical protein
LQSTSLDRKRFFAKKGWCVVNKWPWRPAKPKCVSHAAMVHFRSLQNFLSGKKMWAVASESTQGVWIKWNKNKPCKKLVNVVAFREASRRRLMSLHCSWVNKNYRPFVLYRPKGLRPLVCKTSVFGTRVFFQNTFKIEKWTKNFQSLANSLTQPTKQKVWRDPTFCKSFFVSRFFRKRVWNRKTLRHFSNVMSSSVGYYPKGSNPMIEKLWCLEFEFFPKHVQNRKMDEIFCKVGEKVLHGQQTQKKSLTLSKKFKQVLVFVLFFFENVFEIENCSNIFQKVMSSSVSYGPKSSDPLFGQRSTATCSTTVRSFVSLLRFYANISTFYFVFFLGLRTSSIRGNFLPPDINGTVIQTAPSAFQSG